MKERTFVSRLKWIIPAAVLLILIGYTVTWWAESSRGDLPVLGEVPGFEMTERSGQPFGRANLNGKISVVDFIFTKCPGICPTMSANMVQLYEHFENEEKVQFVSISVDPDRDSLHVLRDYAESFGVDDNRWIFLRAPIEEVIDLCENGFMLPADGLPMGHTTRFVLVDQKGRIRAYYDGMDEASIRVIIDHVRLVAGEE